MNKEDIKEALECCCNSDFKTACRNCSYLGSPRCNDTLCKDALNLITEQEKEIERLKAEQEKRLTCDFVKTAQKQAQIDVLNRLKSSSIYDDNYLDGYVFLDDINNIIEELGK